MSNINANIKNAAIISGEVNPVSTNVPAQYGSRLRQHYDPATRLYTQQMARFSSDFVVAQIQGIDPKAPEEWGSYRIRFADVVNPSSAIQRHFDDYKVFLFESASVEYLRPGTKIKTMGSTWLVINPMNVSGSSGSGLCRRCNAVWNFLDYYGNVISEPIIAENERANANDPDTQNSQQIAKGYFNITCQYNKYTRQIDTNTRMILGTGAYRVTGYSDFETEFTGDYSTVRMLNYTVRYEEPNEAIDDMENHIAGGLAFSWSISVHGQAQLAAGSTTAFTAQSIRNNIPVFYTNQFPIHYEWDSSDESVATVDNFGNVEAVAEGKAVITATLYENSAYSASYEITVTESADGVAFNGTIPVTMNAFESATISVAYFEESTETAEILKWTFSGADPTAYSAEVAEDGKSAAITCFGYSDTPLTITAEYGGYSASANITLLGI